MSSLVVRRLVSGDEEIAREMFAMMANVFEDDSATHPDEEPLGTEGVRELLARQEFWAVVAMEGQSVAGGLTAHSLPMTRSRSTEVFIYDLAVRPDRQRKGLGRRLINELLSLARAAGIDTAFVPADNDDQHALDFYRALGGVASPVTFFTFSRS